jgi:Ni/Fe-hydrogenase 1 B-type cytochrome subunit
MTSPIAPPGRDAGRHGPGPAFPAAQQRIRSVPIWGAPLRAMHWIAGACIATLVVTGLYIASPYFSMPGEASAHFAMGRMRFVHFTAAAVLVMTGIVRLYWLFAGNQFERISALFPLTRKNLKAMGSTINSFATLRFDKEPRFVGHNPLQQITYTGVYLTTLFMVVTGFTLYGQSNPGGLIFRGFGWVPPLLGGLQVVRLLHHVLTWAFVIFLILHVYFAIRADLLERQGVVSSMITGDRFVDVSETYEDFDAGTVPVPAWQVDERPRK